MGNVKTNPVIVEGFHSAAVHKINPTQLEPDVVS